MGIGPQSMKTSRLITLSSHACLLFIVLAMTGCGTSKYEHELDTEEASIKLYNETTDGGYQLISTAELKELIDGDEEFLLVDAMPAEDSYNKQHIAGAVNFEFPKEVIDEWNDDTMGARQKEDFEALLGDDKNRRSVMYCGFVKCARSHNAAVFARELGYTNVYLHPGGLFAWQGAGYPLAKD